GRSIVRTTTDTSGLCNASQSMESKHVVECVGQGERVSSLTKERERTWRSGLRHDQEDAPRRRPHLHRRRPGAIAVDLDVELVARERACGELLHGELLHAVDAEMSRLAPGEEVVELDQRAARFPREEDELEEVALG